MRSSVVATLVFLGLIGLGVRAQTMRPVAEIGHRSAARPQQTSTVKEIFEAKGLPQATQAKARQAALKVAQEELRKRILARYPHTEYVPTTEYIDRNLVRGPAHTARVGDIDKSNPVVSEAKPDTNTDDYVIVTLQVEFTDELLAQARHYEQEQLVKARMFDLGRILALVVLVLGAVAAYVRADEWTRGYYTGRLRALAVGAVAAGAAAVWFLT